MADDKQGVVIAELNRRIEALDGAHARAQLTQLAADLDAIRRLAAANGFAAVTPVIHALEAALGRGERGPHVSSGLSLLRDAVSCGRDARSGAALAAACSLRVTG